ncbi:MAG: hypothetical protein JWP11_3694 [Frankiales bacterium]|nr:hypothetical protein [Frankiales bacterium]
MARIRSIKPSIWTDERFIDLGRDARLLFLGMISHADDAGRLVASGAALIGAVFPHDDISPRNVEKWRDEIATSGLITVYRAGRGTYAHLHGWHRHQRIQKPQPSTLPAPPVSDRVHDQSRTESRTQSTTEWEVEVEKEVEKEKECASQSDAARTRSSTPSPTATALVATHVDALTDPPPATVVVDLERRVHRLLTAGSRPEHITAGLTKLRRKGLSARLLDQLVAESIQPAHGAPGDDPLTDPDVAAWIAEQEAAQR